MTLSSRVSKSERSDPSLRSVLVLANAAKPEVLQLAAELEPWLRDRVPKLEVVKDIRAFSEARDRMSLPQRAEELPDLVIVLGGDGALLGAVRAFAQNPVPTLGINLGRVGFLASTPASHWRETLENILGGQASEIELRSRLRCTWEAGDGQPMQAVALNEVGFQRSSHGGMLRASLSVNEIWVTDYRADGLLVATPSGSTAYSLSAGGPILEPQVDAFVVTPVCAQSLSNRPIVLSAVGVLRITLDQNLEPTTLAIDGQIFHELKGGASLCIERHPTPYPLHSMAGLDPNRRLRDRLGWSGGVFPKDSED